MLTRRLVLHSATAALGGPVTLAACSSETSDESYEAASRRTWRPATGQTSDSALVRSELVRLATLAPSSHNTQCWKFRVEESAITILPDLSRRCPAVDPDDHHLFVSLGCAAENLTHAALANGLNAQSDFASPPAAGVRLKLDATKAFASPLFAAITDRQCTRAPFDGRAVSNAELKLLVQAGTGRGVNVVLMSEKAMVENVLQYVIEGNAAQMNDRAFVAELKAWIRFGGGEAVRTADGLYSVSSGNPSLPRWLGSRLFDLFFTAKGENEKYAKHLRSSAGVAVFVSDADDSVHWVEAGRCYERFALQATALGIRNAMINQPIEVANLRSQFAAFVNTGGRRPDLVVRFGRGPAMPRSLRRSVQSVLV